MMDNPHKRHNAMTFPEATIHQQRLPIFSPRPNAIRLQRPYKIKNEYGSLELDGYMLGQNHKHIIESMLGSMEAEWQIYGNCTFVFSFHQIQKTTGMEIRSNRLEKLFKEMAKANYTAEYKDKKGSKHLEVFHVLDYFAAHETAKGKTGKAKYIAAFNPRYLDFFNYDICCNWPDLMPMILQLKPGAQALVRYLLTHNFQHKSLSNLLKTMGVSGGKNMPLSYYQASNVRKEILAEQEALLEAFDIEFDFTMNKSLKNPIIRYREKIGGVWFTKEPS